MAKVRALRRRSAAARIPERLADLRGPAVGTVVLPMHLTWHGHREFDVSDDAGRLLMYTIVLSKGTRNDVARFLHPDLLRADWPKLHAQISPPVRDACARSFGLTLPG